MPTLAKPAAPPAAPEPVHRFTVDQYHRMIDAGILGTDDRVELIDGQILPKMPNYPPHAWTNGEIRRWLDKLCGPSWDVRQALPITLSASEPEPDVAVARVTVPKEYSTRHPGPADCALVVEVSYSSLDHDRAAKLAIYARDKISVYWIVDLNARCIEVYEVPNGTRAKPRYKVRRVYAEGEAVPVFLNGRKVGEIAVADILPKK